MVGPGATVREGPKVPLTTKDGSGCPLPDAAGNGSPGIYGKDGHPWGRIALVAPEVDLESIRAAVMRAAAVTEEGSVSSIGIGEGVVRVHLWASQEAFAADLAARYRGAVDLTVGLLHYPDRRPPDELARARWLRRPPEAPPLPDTLEVSAPGALVVRSGRHLRSTVELSNHSQREHTVATNGGVTGTVVDPSTGEVAGVFEGAQVMPLRLFRAPPGGTTSIPLLVGTASPQARLGYATPPGGWALEVLLDMEGLGTRRAPWIPLTVTE